MNKNKNENKWQKNVKLKRNPHSITDTYIFIWEF